MKTKGPILISGYSSFDHMIHLETKPEIGKTSLIKNASCNQIYWGGCSVNIAVALSKLGIGALPALRVGGDFYSSGFADFLSDHEIAIDEFPCIENETNSASFLIGMPDGEHITTFYTGAMDEKYAEPFPEKWFSNASAALITVASNRDNKNFLSMAKKASLPIYFGMKGDYNAFTRELLEEILYSAEIIFMNETEEKQISQFLGLDKIERLFEEGKCKTILVTLGEKGVRYIQREGKVGVVPAFKVMNPVDTTGCGDAFISGFLYGLNNSKDIGICCKLGCALSSFVIEKEGCCSNLPDEASLLARVNDKK